MISCVLGANSSFVAFQFLSISIHHSDWFAICVGRTFESCEVIHCFSIVYPSFCISFTGSKYQNQYARQTSLTAMSFARDFEKAKGISSSISFAICPYDFPADIPSPTIRVRSSFVSFNNHSSESMKA